MIWYLLNILIVTVAYLFPVTLGGSRTDIEKENLIRKRVCVVGTICWIVLSGLRHYSVGDDTQSYGVRFETVKSTSWGNLWERVVDKYILGVEGVKDPGYPLFQKIIQIFVKDYQVYLVLVAALFFIAFGIFLYKFSQNPYIGYILFSSLFYSFFAITGTRQTIATAFVVLIGVHLIRKKKLVAFVLLTLLASSIHMSCLCFLPFYFISRIKINRITLSLYWIVTVLAFAFRYEFLELLQSVVGYDTYGDEEGAGVGTFMVLLIFVGILITCFCKKMLEINEEIATIGINAVMLSCVFSSLLLITPAMMRVVQYYSLFLVVVIPEFASVLPKKNDKRIYYMIVVGILVTLLVISEPTYKFFWQ